MERSSEIETELDKERLKASSLETSLEELSRNRGRNRISRRPRPRPLNHSTSGSTFVTAPGTDTQPSSKRLSTLKATLKVPTLSEIPVSTGASIVRESDQFAIAPPISDINMTAPPSTAETTGLALSPDAPSLSTSAPSLTVQSVGPEEEELSQENGVMDTVDEAASSGAPEVTDPPQEVMDPLPEADYVDPEDSAPELPPHLRPDYMYLDPEALRRPSISNDEEYERLRQTVIDSYGLTRVEHLEQTMSELISSYNKKDEEFVKLTVPEFMTRARVKPSQTGDSEASSIAFISRVDMRHEETQTEALFTGQHERPKHRTFPMATQTILSGWKSTDCATQTSDDTYVLTSNKSFKKQPLTHVSEKRLTVMTGKLLMKNDGQQYCKQEPTDTIEIDDGSVSSFESHGKEDKIRKKLREQRKNNASLRSINSFLVLILENPSYYESHLNNLRRRMCESLRGISRRWRT